MSSYWGENIRISIFGQSHSAGIGVVIDRLPSGLSIDKDALAAFLRRRAPGQSRLTTPRAEADEVEFISGLHDGKTCGAPLCAVIKNTNTRPSDYSQFSDIPRPGHADYTSAVKYKGYQDPSGGGHYSGRLTAPLCIAGGICLQLLEAEGIYIGSHIAKIAGVADDSFNPVTLSREDFMSLTDTPLRVINKTAGEAMVREIESAREDGDSVGGIVECGVVGLPAGIGEHMFGGLENRISSVVFGIPAVRGIEFGAGFAAAEMRGSQNNDVFVKYGDGIHTATNNHGGILGGISSGMPLIFRVAIKPTPSISRTQTTLNLRTGEMCELSVKGRHDPCILPRALPPVEAAAALAIYDALLDAKKA